MEEISGRTFPFYERFARSRGIPVERLVEGLSIRDRLPALRRGQSRMPWDDVAAMCNRLEAAVGLDAMFDGARLALDDTFLADPIRRLAGLLLTPRRAYRALVRWVVPQLYDHVGFTLRDLDGGGLELSASIPSTYAGSTGFFAFIAGATRIVPCFLDQPEARILERELRGHGFRVVVEPPPSKWRTRLRITRRALSAEAALEELGQKERELRQQAVALEASERFGRTLLDSVQEIIAILDLDGSIRYVNRSVEPILGYTLESLGGRSVFDLVHPDDRALLAASFAEGVGRPGYRAALSLRVRDATSAWRDLEVSGVNLRDDPVIHGLLINGRDVTEKKRAEAALREREHAYSVVLANLSGMAYRYSLAHGVWELVTDGCEALTGYSRAELRSGQAPSLDGLVHADEAASARERRRAALEAGKPFSLEHRIVRRSGEPRWVLDVGRGVRDQQGEIAAIEGFMTDVTSRKELEEQLTHSQRLEGLGRLAGGVAHDFNNLLAAMLGYASVVAEDLPAGSPSRADVEQIIDAANRAAELTRQLLAFARKQVIQPRVVDLGEVIVGLDRLLRRVLRADVELVTAPGPGGWKVEADPSQIEQVLLNLAVNARDAMPNGGKLTIGTRNVSLDSEQATDTRAAIPPGDYVLLCVSDTGVGIDPDVMPYVFEPFFTTKGVGEGTGLGLATCHGIVHQAGGHIFVSSEVGRGTTFDIYLPRSLRDATSLEPATRSARRGGDETILVVEDHPMLRDVTARTLLAEGYRVLVASSGAEALSVLEREPAGVDLLLTDVVMPQMSGHALADAVRAARPAVRVLFVSGYAESSVIESGAPATGIAFLAKPFTPSALCAKVRAVLDRPTEPSR